MAVRGLMDRHIDKDCRSDSEDESATESDESVMACPPSAVSIVPSGVGIDSSEWLVRTKCLVDVPIPMARVCA